MSRILQFFFKLSPSAMLHLEDLQIPENLQLVLGAAAACLGVLVVRAFVTKSDSSLPLPPSPPTWRLQGHFVPTP